MVATPRKIEIRDGKIALPEDMLEESGIGTSDGIVLVDLRESGEIVVRASPSRSGEFPVSPALAAVRAYIRDHPQSTDTLTTQEQIEAWDEDVANSIIDHFNESMRDSEDGE